MPQKIAISPLNNFSKGLKTEFTGLNFPEDAVTETSNCVFERIGNVHRRPGIDYETNKTLTAIDRTSRAINTYKWNNVGGDGATQIVAVQVGATLRFFRSSTATVTDPLSDNLLASTITVSTYTAAGGTFDATLECQFADGNGYLFVFHPSCDPFYCTYSAGTITATAITVQIRDFAGIPDNLMDDYRPTTLSAEHNYNLVNQGWVQGSPWNANVGFPATIGPTGGSNTFTITTESNITAIAPGDTVTGVFTGYLFGNGFQSNFTGTVSAYTAGVSIVLNPITAYSDSGGGTSTNTGLYSSRLCNLTKKGTADYITDWFTSQGNYPSNTDVWWTFKDTSGVFDPTTSVNVTQSGLAPKGHIILDAFNQQRTTASSVTGITAITTTVRPRTGAFFQGRVWYTGADASQAATGDAPYTTWTENIYFSQILERPNQIGRCYQVNDPTDERLFDLLPNDGGVIVVQGSGSIYKLFPIQNGMLIFAANGIWFITGSQGIGFTANDYTVTKLSGIQSISSTSYVDVQGYPMWCNAEGIYGVVKDQSGALKVEPVTFATIQTFYDTIPLSSKKYIRGSYDPLDWQVRWLFKSEEEASITDRYQFDGVLVFNTAVGSFYNWTIASSSTFPYVHGVNYVQSPGGSAAPEPVFKYLTSRASGATFNFTFSEEKDETNWVDWFSINSTGLDYTSTFTGGYRIKGGSAFNFQTNYIYMYLNNDQNASYRMQGHWDWAINQNSGKWTTLELTTIDASTTNFGVARRRHRIRGRGMAIQFKITSVAGEPFDIIGWTVQDVINPGV